MEKKYLNEDLNAIIKVNLIPQEIENKKHGELTPHFQSVNYIEFFNANYCESGITNYSKIAISRCQIFSLYNQIISIQEKRLNLPYDKELPF